MRTKFLSTLLALCMVLALLPASALAENYPTSGNCGEDATWTYDDSTKTLTISGSGEIDYFRGNEGNNSFNFHNIRAKIEKVKFNGSFTVIGDNTFSDFFNLEEIVIPNTIISIGYYAFYNCAAITSISIPENVIRINYENAFDGCTSLRNIYVDSKNKIYASQDGMLLDKEKVTLLVCPSGKDECTIPQNVENIVSSAFKDCSNLAELIIPDNVTNCSSLHLSSCTSLNKITLSGSVKRWNRIYAPGKLTTAIVNEGTTSFSGTFSGASNLTTVYLPASLEMILDGTFANCSSLSTIYFAGTEAQWNALKIGYGNQEISLANIVCNTPIPAPSEVPSTPGTSDTPNTPDIPTTPTQLTATVTTGGLGKKVSIQVQSGHWLTIQTRRAGSLSISSIQAPATTSGVATVSFSAPSGSVVQIWETETEMQFSNGVPTTPILSTVTKNL